MKSIATLLLAGALLAGASFTTACAVESSESESVGKVKMNLTGTSVEGNIYRLRAATFTIDSATPTVLDTEADPNLTVLSADLSVGDYTSTLGGPWYLERQDAGGAFVAVDALLISENPLPFSVLPSTATDIVYQFSTDGTVVTIGDGSVNISIDVIEQGATNCTVFASGSCPTGETCTLVDIESSGGICIPVGAGVFNDPCGDTTDCAADHVCADAGSGLICIEVCDIAIEGGVCASGVGTCQNAFGSSLYGACF